MVKIKDICIDISDGSHNPPKGIEHSEYMMLSSKNIFDDKITYAEPRYLTEDEFCVENKRTKISKGDVLMTIVGTVGRTAVVGENQRFTLQRSVAVLRPNQEICASRYLMYALQGKRKYIESEAKGVAQKGIYLGQVADLDIPLTDLDRQEKIVENLDCVKSIVDNRTKQIEELDNLIKSRFVEMFGNLVTGDKFVANKHKIGEIASVTKLAGFEFTKYIKYKEQGDIIMLRGLNCKKGHLILDDIKWIDKDTSDLLPRSKLYYGDILMTYAGTIGDVAMIDANDKYHLAPNVAKISLNDNENYNPVFMIHLFMYSHDYIMTFASQVAQASINMEKIRNFEYYFPPVELQKEFATFVTQVDKLKFV